MSSTSKTHHKKHRHHHHHHLPFKGITFTPKEERMLKKIANMGRRLVAGPFVGSGFENAKLTPPPMVLNPQLPQLDGPEDPAISV